MAFSMPRVSLFGVNALCFFFSVTLGATQDHVAWQRQDQEFQGGLRELHRLRTEGNYGAWRPAHDKLFGRGTTAEAIRRWGAKEEAPFTRKVLTRTPGRRQPIVEPQAILQSLQSSAEWLQSIAEATRWVLGHGLKAGRVVGNAGLDMALHGIGIAGGLAWFAIGSVTRVIGKATVAGVIYTGNSFSDLLAEARARHAARRQAVEERHSVRRRATEERQSVPRQAYEERQAETECAICFKDFASRRGKIECPQCHRSMCAKCHTRWDIRQAGAGTCPFCREPYEGNCLSRCCRRFVQ